MPYNGFSGDGCSKRTGERPNTIRIEDRSHFLVVKFRCQ